MIIRRKHRAHYAIVPNATADDDNLAADALGVLVYLLAKPDDWKVSVANIRERFGLGKHRVYGILEELAGAGYVQRRQARNPESRFVNVEYIVHDTPQACDEAREEPENTPATPLPENREAVELTPDPAPVVAISPITASRNSASRKSGRLLSTKDNNPSFGRGDAPERALEEKERGQSPPKPTTLNAQVWTEAKAILSPKEFGCVAGWLQRVKDRPKGLEVLLAIIATAKRQGTAQPVPYITTALAKEFPPPPDPKTINRGRWELLVQAAINLKTWTADYGPRPGEPGCLVPQDLITPELLRAVSMRRAA